MSFRIGGVRVRLHPLLPVFWGVTALLGRFSALFPALAALALHESGHLLAARLWRVRILEIEITPYGGVMAVEQMEGLSPGPAFFLALGGPLFSLVGCCLALPLLRTGWANFDFTAGFFRGNLFMLTVNLLPALPLDGGRMLRALLTRRMPFARANRWLVYAGYAAGSALCLLSVVYAWRGELNFSPAFGGLYLLYAAYQENKQSLPRYISSLIGRRLRLEKGDRLPVEVLAIGEGATPREVTTLLSPGKYHWVQVVAADGLGRLGGLDEKALCDFLLDGGENARTLGEYLAAKNAP